MLLKKSVKEAQQLMSKYKIKSSRNVFWKDCMPQRKSVKSLIISLNSMSFFRISLLKNLKTTVRMSRELRTVLREDLKHGQCRYSWTTFIFIHKIKVKHYVLKRILSTLCSLLCAQRETNLSTPAEDRPNFRVESWPKLIFARKPSGQQLGEHNRLQIYQVKWSSSHL